MKSDFGKRDAGLTLIELVAAMAVFALVAVMGLQSLTAMLHNRDHLAYIDSNTRALSLTLARLRNDLSTTTPMVFYPPNRQPPVSAIYQNSDGNGFSLSINGQSDLNGAQHTHRALWRIDTDTKTLYRQVWTALTPSASSALQPEVLIMEGAKGFRFRSYWPSIGWHDGLNGPDTETAATPPLDDDVSGGAPEVYSDILPDAVEITIDTTQYGEITMIEAFK